MWKEFQNYDDIGDQPLEMSLEVESIGEKWV